jgi:hypothetical protein
MTTKQATRPTKFVKTEAGKFDQMLEAWRAGKEIGWSDLLAAWVEAPPAPRSPDMLVKVIQSVGAK